MAASPPPVVAAESDGPETHRVNLPAVAASLLQLAPAEEKGRSMMGVRCIAMALVCLSSASTVNAGNAYIGASLGIMDADVSGVDEATNAGLLLGYDVYTREIFSVSLEGEFTTTVADGDLHASGSKGDWDIDTQAAYVAFRLGDQYYIKARFGFAWTDVSASINEASFHGSDSGVSWGGAFGWMLNERWGLQLDGTMVDSDVTYWNVGVLYRF